VLPIFRQNIRCIALLLLVLLSGSAAAPAQRLMKKVRGQVLEASSGLPVPYASVLLKASGIQRSAMTNDSGYFALSVPAYKFPATIMVMVLGYATKEVVLDKAPRELVTVSMEEQTTALAEVVVRPGENPAHPIIRSIIAHKKRNNPGNLASYTADVYQKTFVQLRNIDSAFLAKRGMLNMLQDAIVAQPDSVKRYTLPLMFSERWKTIGYNRSPRISTEVVLDSNSVAMPVLDAEIFSDYMQFFSQEVNVYDDNIVIGHTPLVSPISSLGLSYYTYRLLHDTVYDPTLGLREYRIRFAPKNPRDAAFYGELTVYDSLFALKKIAARLSPKSNVPYVIRCTLDFTYTLPDSATPFVATNEIDMDFHLWKFMDTIRHAAAGFTISNRYSNVRLNPSTAEVEAMENVPDYLQARTAAGVSPHPLHPDSLSGVEAQAATALNNLNRKLWIVALNRLGEVLGGGCYSLDKVDIGPYTHMVKLNGLEGLRLNLALRTSARLHPQLCASGMVGYGTCDQRFKGMLNLSWKRKTRRREVLSAEGKYDTYRVGNNLTHLALLRENAIGLDDDVFWRAAFAVRTDYRYAMCRGGFLSHEREWRRWLSSTLRVSAYDFMAGPYVPFTRGGAPVGAFSQQEASLGLRISSNSERRSDFFGHRVYLGNGNLPILSPSLTLGRYALDGNGSGSFYGKAHLAVKQHLTFGTTQLLYMLEAGAIVGAVPFPALEWHRSNESNLLARYKFNLLYNLTVASDLYASCLVEYNLNGLLFNKIPLVERLNIKELLGFKLLYGTLNKERHSRALDMPDYLHTLRSPVPYVEAYAGLKNIFQLFSIGGCWRVPLDGSGKPPYAFANFAVVLRVMFEI
jgi:hypothetical protein